MTTRAERQAKRSELGRRAEQVVAERLVADGFEILERNLHVGRDELDVIARRGHLLVVCEVRARSDDTWVSPAETITKNKAASVRRATASYMRSLGLQGLEVRLDVASVMQRGSILDVNYLEGAL